MSFYERQHFIHILYSLLLDFSFRPQEEDEFSIAELEGRLEPSEADDSVEDAPPGATFQSEADTQMVTVLIWQLRATGCIGLAHSALSAFDWIIGSSHNPPQFLSSQKCTRSWWKRARYLFLPDHSTPTPPFSPHPWRSSDGVYRGPLRWREWLQCILAYKMMAPGKPTETPVQGLYVYFVPCG